MKYFRSGLKQVAMIRFLPFMVAFFLLLTGFPISLLSNQNDQSRAFVASYDTNPDPVKGCRGANTIIQEDDFDDGWGNFSHSIGGQGVIVRQTQADADSLAYSGNSVFMWAANRNAWDYSYMWTTVNLINTSKVYMDFQFALEDIENHEHLYIWLDTDGDPSNGYSHQRWREAPKGANGNNNDFTTEPQDYQLVTFDLSNITKTANLLILFEGLFYRSGMPGDMFAIDDVVIRANYKPQLTSKDDVNISPSVVHTLTDEFAKINVTYHDKDDHQIEDFSVTMDVRLADNTTVIRYMNNKSLNDPLVSIERIAPMTYNMSIIFDPAIIYGFGFVDFFLVIFDPDDLHFSLYFNYLNDILELLDHEVVINDADTKASPALLNVEADDPLEIVGTFTDLDDQPISDFTFDFIIRDQNSVEYPLGPEIVAGDDDFTLIKEDVGEYSFSLLFELNSSYPSSLYDIFVEIDDGYIEMNQSSFIDNPEELELFSAAVSDIIISPEPYNIYHQEPLYLNFTVTENIALNNNGFSLRESILNSGINISLRDSENEELVLYSQKTRGRTNAPILQNLTNDTFLISFKYEDAFNLSKDVFDLKLSIFNSEAVLLESDYEDNEDILTTFYNIVPRILNVWSSHDLINIYYNPTIIIGTEMRDRDMPDIGDLLFSLALRNDDGGEIVIFDGSSSDVDGLEFSEYLDENGTFLLNYSVDIDGGFEQGFYDVEVSIEDEYGMKFISSYSESLDLFELYYNEPPNAPSKFLPNETSDRSPLLHWYGASDSSVATVDLTYSLKIGTDEGRSDILDWYDVGKNPFYTITDVLDYGLYYVEVIANDGQDNSLPYKDSFGVFALANTPPLPPNEISPDYSLETLPLITWKGASDPDGDTIRNNYLQIGTYSYGGDVLSWVNVRLATEYQIVNTLPLGNYFVQVKVSDGTAMSYVQQEMLYIISEGNVPPSPPTEMYPITTWERKPTITWSGAYDYNEEDTLTYSIQIGSSSGKGDVLSWIDDIPETKYAVTSELNIGEYWIQIKAHDGELFSNVFERKLTITEVGNLPPLAVGNITPTTTTNSTPLIKWSPSTDSDGDEKDITYYIQIGFALGHGDFLSWYTTKDKTEYQISKELSPNRKYFVQVKAFDGESFSSVEYGTLELLVYLSEISFQGNITSVGVYKEEVYTFDLLLLGRGTAGFDVDLKIETSEELSEFVNLSIYNIFLSPGDKVVIILALNIPASSDITGNFSVHAVSDSPFYSDTTEVPLTLSILKRDEPDPTFFEDVSNDPMYIIGFIALLLLLILLILLIVIIKRRKDQAPEEIIDRDEKDLDGVPELTFTPIAEKGLVTKTIVPDSEKILSGKYLALKGGKASKKVPQLPGSTAAGEKKRLALPQHSVVIDMDSQQVVGHTKVDERKDDEKEDVVFDFESVGGKYVIKDSLPPESPYGTSYREDVTTESRYSASKGKGKGKKGRRGKKGTGKGKKGMRAGKKVPASDKKGGTPEKGKGEVKMETRSEEPPAPPTPPTPASDPTPDVPPMENDQPSPPPE